MGNTKKEKPAINKELQKEHEIDRIEKILYKISKSKYGVETIQDNERLALSIEYAGKKYEKYEIKKRILFEETIKALEMNIDREVTKNNQTSKTISKVEGILLKVYEKGINSLEEGEKQAISIASALEKYKEYSLPMQLLFKETAINLGYMKKEESTKNNMESR